MFFTANRCSLVVAALVVLSVCHVAPADAGIEGLRDIEKYGERLHSVTSRAGSWAARRPVRSGAGGYQAATLSPLGAGADDTAAVRAALQKVSDAGGGVLTLQAGRYNITGPLTVANNVILEGVGWATELWQSHLCTGPLLALGHGSGLRDLLLGQEQPDPNNDAWAPYTDYDFQVRVEQDQATLENLMLLNPYLGIAVEPAVRTASVGQVQLTNIRGQPLAVGIQIDRALDVIHVQQVHFWPFWSSTKGVMAWMSAHGTAVRTLRNDNPLFAQVFCLGYNVGFDFDHGAEGPGGITSKAKISEFDCDFCSTGVRVSADNVRGLSLSQFSYQAPGDGNGNGFHAVGNGVTASISQADITLAGCNAVRVDGRDSAVVVTASIVRSWNLSGKGFPAFEAPGTGSTLVVDSTFYGDGHGAEAGGANTHLGASVLRANVQ